jgi:hypothetical protein
MSQDTRHLVRDQVNLLRDSEQLPFCDLLDEGTIQNVLDQEHVSFPLGELPCGFDSHRRSSGYDDKWRALHRGSW